MNIKNIILLIIVFSLILAYNLIPVKNNQVINKVAEEEIKIKLLEDKKIIEKNLEEYIIGVVAAEMPASFNMEALKAQAIAARTYAMYKKNQNKEYDVTTTVSTQSYINQEKMKIKWEQDYEKYYAKIKQAVNETKGFVLKNNSEIICAYYFAISNGLTEESLNVFGEKLNYITSVDSSWDKNVKNYTVETIFEKNDFCQKLNIDCNEIKIDEIKRNETNYIDYIKINNQIFTGIDVRQKLNLRSADFQIKVKNEIIITTNGYGHGVGMSQHGANEMAKLGKNYEEILYHYYKNVNITKI